MNSNRKPTFLEDIDTIVNVAKRYKLSDALFAQANKQLERVATRLNLSINEALLFSLFMELSNKTKIYISSFVEVLNCSNIRILSFMNDADTLHQRGLIHRIRRSEYTYYTVPIEVVDAIREDKVFTPKPTTNLSEEHFFQVLEKTIDTPYDDECELQKALMNLIVENGHLPFARFVSKHAHLFKEDSFDVLMLCIYTNRLINYDDDIVGEHDWDDYFTNKHNIRRIREGLMRNDMTMCKLNLVELNKSEGVQDNYYYHLTKYAKENMFPNHELAVAISPKSESGDIVKHSSLSKKQLYFSEGVQNQISQLTNLLMPQNFKLVTDRLDENGMRKGFACLFHGTPGTGKTEAVNQIAIATCRDIMMVDVSKVKSCWVGESEKNIKEVFARYRRLVRNSDIAPILLFNEADAILGTRNRNSERAVDKMENAIQNIILQEMEQLEGIMIATTNLTSNLDTAFERRFIFKTEFDRPMFEARKQIWTSMIPSIDSEYAEILASKFDFSGGQIENIARRRVIELILNGNEPTLEQLIEYCNAEASLRCNNSRARVGF